MITAKVIRGRHVIQAMRAMNSLHDFRSIQSLWSFTGREQPRPHTHHLHLDLQSQHLLPLREPQSMLHYIQIAITHCHYCHFGTFLILLWLNMFEPN